MTTNIARFLAVSIVHFSKEFWTPNGTPVFGGGDPPAPTAAESSREMLGAYTELLPGLMKSTRGELLPTAEEALRVAQAVSPAYSALQTQIYGENAGKLAEIGRDIESKNLQAKAAAETELFKGPGLDLIKAADAAQRQVDPEYYATRAKMGEQLGTLLSGKLTGGETEAIQRSVNRNAEAAGMTTPSAERVVQEGMLFGQQATNRLSAALAAATGALPTFKSGVDVMQQAAGRSGMNTSQAQGQFMGVNQQGYGNEAWSMGNNVLNQTGENQRAAMNVNSQRRDTMDRVEQGIKMGKDVLSGVGSMAGGCCFIFMEAYNGELPWFVRHWRDIFAPEDTDRRNGYIKMAKWLVPKMQVSTAWRWFVNTMMVKPMTQFGGWRVGLSTYKYNPINHLINNIWFKIWNLYGKF